MVAGDNTFVNTDGKQWAENGTGRTFHFTEMAVKHAVFICKI